MKLLLLFASLLTVTVSIHTYVSVETIFVCPMFNGQTFRLLVQLKESDAFHTMDKTLQSIPWIDYSPRQGPLKLEGADDDDAGKHFEFYLDIEHTCNEGGEKKKGHCMLEKTVGGNRERCKVGARSCPFQEKIMLPLK